MRRISLAILVLALLLASCVSDELPPDIRRETIVIGMANIEAASRMDENGNPDPIPAPKEAFDAPFDAMDWLEENDLAPGQYILVQTFGADQVAMLRTTLEARAMHSALNVYIVVPPGVSVCHHPRQIGCPKLLVPLLVTPAGDWEVISRGSDWDVRIRVLVYGEGAVIGGRFGWNSPIPAYYRWVSVREMREQQYEQAGAFAWSRVIERMSIRGDEPEYQALRGALAVAGVTTLIVAFPIPGPSPDDVLWLALAGAAVP